MYLRSEWAHHDVKRGRSRDLAALLVSKPSSASGWLNGRTVLSLENGLRMRI